MGGVSSRVIQGHFLAGRPVFHGVVQPLIRGNALAVPAAVEQLLRPGPGFPLPPAVRQAMEVAFETRFTDVRIHTGQQPAALCAQALTVGSNLYFAPGRFQPQSPHGQRLLAHELAHVVQQRSHRVRNPFSHGLAVIVDRQLEAEAAHMSRVAQPFFGFVIKALRRVFYEGPAVARFDNPQTLDQRLYNLREEYKARLKAAPSSSNMYALDRLQREIYRIEDELVLGGRNVGELVGVVGLPGSGKSTLIEEYRQKGYKVLDDIGEDWSRQHDIRGYLINGRNVVVSDIEFCNDARRLQFERAIDVSPQWIFFENDPETAKANVKHRQATTHRNRNVLEECAKIDRLSHVYHPPHNARKLVRAGQ